MLQCLCIIHLVQFREHAVVWRHRCTVVTPTPLFHSRNYEKTGHYLSARGCLGSFVRQSRSAFVSKKFGRAWTNVLKCSLLPNESLMSLDFKLLIKLKVEIKSRFHILNDIFSFLLHASWRHFEISRVYQGGPRSTRAAEIPGVTNWSSQPSKPGNVVQFFHYECEILSVFIRRWRKVVDDNFLIGHFRNVRGLGKSMVVFRLFEKLKYSNERSTIF